MIMKKKQKTKKKHQHYLAFGVSWHFSDSLIVFFSETKIRHLLTNIQTLIIRSASLICYSNFALLLH